MNCLATAKTRTEGADSELDGGLEECSQSPETKGSNIKFLQMLNTEATRDPARPLTEIYMQDAGSHHRDPQTPGQ